MILRRLPEANLEITRQGNEVPLEKKLISKGVPALAVSKAKVKITTTVKKTWQFILEAKDLRPQGLAGYKFKKIFGGKLPSVKNVFHKNPIFREAQIKHEAQNNEEYYLGNIKKDPKDLNNYDGLGKIYMDQGSTQDAKDIYLYLTSHEPSNSDFHAKLAFCFFKLGDFSKASEHYEKSLSLDPSQPNRYYNLGLCYFETGKNEEAIKNFESAISLEPKNPKFYKGLYKVYTKTANFDKAKESLERAKTNCGIENFD